MTIDAYNVMESSLGLAVGGVLLRLFDRFFTKCCKEETPIATHAPEEHEKWEQEHVLSDNESEQTLPPPFPQEKENLTTIY